MALFESPTGDHEALLNKMSPTAQKAALGTMLKSLIDSHNALLAKLDTDTGVNSTDYAATLAVDELPTG